jgi:IS66 C-terminal element
MILPTRLGRRGNRLYAQALAGLWASSVTAGSPCRTIRWNEHCVVSHFGRKSRLFAGSEREAERAAIMYTLIQTVKLNDVDPQAWLADVFARIAGQPQSYKSSLNRQRRVTVGDQPRPWPDGYVRKPMPVAARRGPASTPGCPPTTTGVRIRP